MFEWFYKLEEKLNHTKRIEYTFNNIPFVCYVGCGCFNNMVEISIYRIKPDKKYFKEKYFGSKWFWLDDYKTIEEGVSIKLCEMFKEREKELKRQNKWKEFFEKTLDK